MWVQQGLIWSVTVRYWYLLTGEENVPRFGHYVAFGSRRTIVNMIMIRQGIMG